MSITDFQMQGYRPSFQFKRMTRLEATSLLLLVQDTQLQEGGLQFCIPSLEDLCYKLLRGTRKLLQHKLH